MADRGLSRRRALAAVATAGVGGFTGCAGVLDGPASSDESESTGGTAEYHVAPDGSDDASGSEGAPLASIGEGLDRAHAGDTVRLRPGEYREELRTVRAGAPDEPITITGPPEAVWRAHEDTDTLFNVVHSHVHVRGVTMNGLVADDRAFEGPDAYATSLVTVSPWATHRDDDLEPVDYLEDVVLEPSRMGHSGAGFIGITRLRHASIGGFEVIGPAGVHFHPKADTGIESHVGEIIYAGTSVDDLERYPWDTLDRTRDVRIHHIDNSEGYHHSQFVDLKLGTEDVTVEYCTDRNAGNTTDGVEAAAIELKGNDCTARWNDVGDCRWGFIFGAWASPTDHADGDEWSRGHKVYGNRIHGFSEAPFKFYEGAGGSGPTSPDAQRIICGNRIEGAAEDEYAYATGQCGSAVPAGDGTGHTGGDGR